MIIDYNFHIKYQSTIELLRRKLSISFKMNVFVDSSEYTWAIIFLIGCKNEPFVKTPIIPNTVLAAQAVVGLNQDKRFVNCNGTVANNLVAQYKPFMFCGPEYFVHMDKIVELTNSFFDFVRFGSHSEYVDRDTAYGMCMAMLPATTTPDAGLHALLTPFEVKELTRNPAAARDVDPIRFEPRPIMEENVVRYVK